MSEKGKFWSAVLYQEGLVEDWQECIGERLQLPGVYVIHDKDLDKDGDARKPHVHVMICFNNTTTQRCAKNLLLKLAKEGAQPIARGGEIESVHSVRNMFEYFIHNTDDARKKGKHQYDAKNRVCFNGFDIGLYEQTSIEEKSQMCMELCDWIAEQGFTNFAKFYRSVRTEFDSGYFKVVQTYSGLFDRMIKGNYHEWLEMQDKNNEWR